MKLVLLFYSSNLISNTLQAKSYKVISITNTETKFSFAESFKPLKFLKPILCFKFSRKRCQSCRRGRIFNYDRQFGKLIDFKPNFTPCNVPLIVNEKTANTKNLDKKYPKWKKNKKFFTKRIRWTTKIKGGAKIGPLSTVRIGVFRAASSKIWTKVSFMKRKQQNFYKPNQMSHQDWKQEPI